MTATESNVPSGLDRTWTPQLEQLRTRYKHVREPILVALQILIANPEIALDDAKAKAAAHGVRITAASVSAAQRLFSRMDVAPVADEDALPKPTVPAKPKRERGPRANDGGVDAESLIRQVVGKLQNQGSVEADRLRTAMRKAVALLQTALGA